MFFYGTWGVLEVECGHLLNPGGLPVVSKAVDYNL